MKQTSTFMAIIGLILSLYAHFTLNQSDKEENQSELYPLIQTIAILNETDAQLDHWNVIVKSERHLLTTDEYASINEHIESVLDDFTWQDPIQQNAQIVRRATKRTPTYQLEETVTIMTHLQNNQYDTRLSYEITSPHWQEDTKNDIISHILTRTSELFHEKPRFFTCVTGKFSDTMKIVLRDEAMNIMQLFNANFVESLEEESFVSLSAYTDQWDARISTKDQSMNLQIALRNERTNEPTHVLIGTPILITEY